MCVWSDRNATLSSAIKFPTADDENEMNEMVTLVGVQTGVLLPVGPTIYFILAQPTI